MANTIIEIAPRPASGTPHNVVMRALAGATGSPAASYTLSAVNVRRYTFTVSQALIGTWGYDVRDSGNTIIESGFVYIAADDTNTYYGGADPATAYAAKLLLDVAAVDSQNDTLSSSVSSLSSAVASLGTDLDALDAKINTSEQRHFVATVTRGNGRVWDSLVDVRGLAEHWDASDGFTVLSAVSDDVRANLGDTVEAWMGRKNGWRGVNTSALAGPIYENVSGIPGITFGGNSTEHRLEITDTDALDAIRNKGFVYVFAVVKPAVSPGHSQTFLAVSTGTSNSNARAFAYTNNSGRFNSDARATDAANQTSAFTNTAQYSGGWVVAVHRFEFASGFIRAQRDNEGPQGASSSVALPSSVNTSDTRALAMRIGSGLGASYNNNMRGPITDLLLATPDTVYSDAEIAAIVAGLASRKGITT